MSGNREAERRKLADIINHWNANRLDLFEISQPTEDLEFHGVMRFYFQDRVAGNFATKCVRVSSTATTQDVIETLAEKFRPDMRMLSLPKYSLYEVNVSGEERRLDLGEKPLVVQLNWNRDDREGRFVLKNENDFIPKKMSNGPEKQEKEGVIQNFKRTLSKKEKKKDRRKEKEASIRVPDGDGRLHRRDDGESSRLAAEVYKDMPETSFTRTISNPEVVMKRRRQQKLERRMEEFRSGDGRPDSGGTLRIYADSLKPNIPYKTILLSTTDTADFAVTEALEKYGLERENPREYCIARTVLAPGSQRSDHRDGKEMILEDSECPLQIFRDWPGDKDGSDSRDKPKLFRLQHSITPVGSEKMGDHSIQLFEPGILSHHCDLMLEDGLVTVTPRCLEAETLVDGRRISETTVLRSGATLQFASSNVFKFVDPAYDQSMARRAGDIPGMRSSHKSGSIAEATFDPHRDLGGRIALPTSKSSGKLEMSSGKSSERGVVKPLVRPDAHNGRSQDSLGPELTLPASIEFRDSSEDAFLSAVINYTNSSTVHFKLSPTYALYMTCRFVLSSRYRPDMSPAERTHRVIAVVNKMVRMMEGVIQETAGGGQKQKNMGGALAFWMANASELLNFIKQDKDLSRITLDAQDVLAHLVQVAFKYLVYCLQADLGNHMPAFLEDPEEHDSQLAKIGMLNSHLLNTDAEDVLHTLTGAMALLRRCRVNAALTIQLFSQLFHFINMWLFNKLVTEGDSGLCSHYWGAILRMQLSRVEAWAEKQGLELAADCHLSRIVQATTLLTMDKYSMQDVQNIHNTCFKLNSLQLNALLSNYHCAPDEPYELARSDGREVQLEEDPDLQLPFLLPEDGYSCDVVRALPSGFQEFLEPLCQRGFCRLVPLPRSPGTWTVHFSGVDCEGHLSAGTADLPMRKEPEIVTVTLKKNKGMGLSIVAAKGAGQEKLGIYVKSVVRGGVADLDGRLAAGDQLLSVDGRSLVGLSQERAAELMTRTGSVVTLEVAKRGAIYHGLATLLSQSSPMTQRGSENGRSMGKSRPKSEGFELYGASAQNGSAGTPPGQRGHYPAPRRVNGEERLLKKRADHLSSPNVANQPESPAAAYSGGPGAKITSVSTGNLFADEEPPSPCPEAYPIPTQTYTRDYFSFPTPLSPDMGSQASGRPWQSSEDRPASPGGVRHTSVAALQRTVLSQEELREEKASYGSDGLRPEDAAPPRIRGNGELRNHHPAPSSLESSTSSQEQLSYSSSSSSSSSKIRQANHKSGPGRWKTPHSQPARSELPPPPPPPPSGGCSGNADPPVPDLPLPPPALSSAGQLHSSAADRKRREEQRRWYEREKARLEEERERKRREQERKLGQIRGPMGPIAPGNQPHGPPPPPPPPHLQHQSPRPPHPPPALPRGLPPPPPETVIRDFLPQQQPHTVERRDLRFVTLGAEEPSSDSLSPDPWKRDAREQLEKRQRLRVVDLLDGEIRELREKVGRTPEENERLRRLQLEWQFQQRLQESKRSEDDEDEDEEEDDEDVDEAAIMAQRLEAENRAQDEEQRRKQQRLQGDVECRGKQEEVDEPCLQRPPLPLDYEVPPTTNALPPPPPQRNTSYLKTHAASFDMCPVQLAPYDDGKHEEEPHEGWDQNVGENAEVFEEPQEKWERGGPAEEPTASGEAPETLTFKERQRLFSQDQDASSDGTAS
ncbi:hypothetical protein JZ751_002610 [Albula glossodonta]|uniref:Afadin n=1 Tax=Albula glossodonta TaxID=121402 RepID=A0A8T2N7H0_9TELE|nr:hypothetical protein JZ751_002610 [Albula glossodonta]